MVDAKVLEKSDGGNVCQLSPLGQTDVIGVLCSIICRLYANFFLLCIVIHQGVFVIFEVLVHACPIYPQLPALEYSNHRLALFRAPAFCELYVTHVVAPFWSYWCVRQYRYNWYNL